MPRKPAAKEVYTRQLEESLAFFQERLAELEIAAEASGWMRLTLESGKWEFERSFLDRIIALSRLMYLKNPLIKRSVEVQRQYVWSLGCVVKSEDGDVQGVIDSFLFDQRNECVIGSAVARESLETELAVTGNLFFVFFVDRVKGKVRIRTIDVDQIGDIRCNPEDAQEPWFYFRSHVTASGQSLQEWIPDWRYDPRKRVGSVDNYPVNWDMSVFHVKVGGLRNMKFGVPETYAALDWAYAYKTFLEDWATIMRAYSRMAMQISGMKGKNLGAAKSKLGTSVTSSSSLTETNPPNVTAAWFLSSGGVDIRAVKTAGSTTSAEEGRPLRLMVAAGVGLPDTFLGDVDVGNYATAQTLDRPTELKVVSRQSLWKFILVGILRYVVDWAARSPSGSLRGVSRVAKVLDDDQFTYEVEVNGKKPFIEAKFQDIIERSVNERVRAVAGAFTFFGKPLMDVIPDKRRVARYVLQALGEPNTDIIINELYPPGADVSVHPPQPAQPGAVPQGDEPTPGDAGDQGDNQDAVVN
jgi:hypothetical protein